MNRTERLRRRITAKRTRRDNRHKQWCKKHALSFRGTKTAGSLRDSRDGRTGGEHLRQVAPERPEPPGWVKRLRERAP